MAFYALAFFGWLAERGGRRIGVLAMPLYFVLANVACVFAFYKFLRGEKYASWEPIQEQEEKGNAKISEQTI